VTGAREYDAIVASGLLLQIDCPELALGRHFRAQPMEVADFRKEVALHVEVLNHALRDIPADLQASAKEWREKMVESAAEASEELMNKYLEEGDLSEAEIKIGLVDGKGSVEVLEGLEEGDKVIINDSTEGT